MITTKIVHTIQCDDCGNTFYADQHLAGDARLSASEFEWTSDDDKDYCPECSAKQQQVNDIAYKSAIRVIRQALRSSKDDGSYYHAWQCTIAKAINDEFMRTSSVSLSPIYLHITNNAAKTFLETFIRIGVHPNKPEEL